ncbi:hypothetical protein AB205_0120070 [Aquarana catesbeiana]|uniref:Uncharacterized protein n=1 Tax=Aquarana catesbeiana TaxID=8400 RepID=A0A2G9QKV1_AQUCT|nr:hypothetical protein AB205_0120070 [Aquarana catesbeiana]
MAMLNLKEILQGLYSQIVKRMVSFTHARILAGMHLWPELHKSENVFAPFCHT